MHRFCPAAGKVCIGNNCVSFIAVKTPLQPKINVVSSTVEYPTEEVFVCAHYKVKLNKVKDRDENKNWSDNENEYKSKEQP